MPPTRRSGGLAGRDDGRPPSRSGAGLTSRSNKRARRRPRWRTYLGLLAALLVADACGWLYLYVSVTRTFEGRLWQLPSRVYSAPLVLVPGDHLRPQEITERLDRSGYGHRTGPPERQGQYRQRGGLVEIRVRPFRLGPQQAEARSLRLQFQGDRLVSIGDERGHGLRQAVLEPELLATLYGRRQEEREPVRLEQVPESFVSAVLAAEDSRFFSHSGLDLRGILRAAWANMRRGAIVQGGSTITQQTVKNLYLDQERSWWRKVREAAMAAIVDARYSKPRILEVYLNELYLGQRGAVAICGAQAAARFYFGRDLAELSLGESALLAGLIRSPGRYNPFVHPDRALARRQQVLESMERLGLAPAQAIEAARAEKLSLASGSGGYGAAPHAVDFVRAELAELYSAKVLTEDGLQIHTTLDTRWQARAEHALRSGLERLERQVPAVRGQRRQRALEGVVLVTRPATGEVLAMVGGRDYRQSQFNRAVQAHRQPGSCFKPFVYAAGFEQAVRGDESGLTPATLLDDSPVELTSGGRKWKPENYDGLYRGWVSARQALEESLNVPTVRAAERVGLEETIRVARRCGISSPLTRLPSLALGAQEVTPLELATAYGTLARLGRHVPASIVREVTDSDGKPVARRKLEETSALSPQAAFLVDHVLQGVLVRGTAQSASALGYAGAAAGKTGTTDDTRDAWFVGYTPELLALVWVGYDDNARTGLTGATGALPIWVDLMTRAEDVHPSAGFREPEGIVRREIDPESGGLAVSGCPQIQEELFASGTEPTWDCDLHEGRLRRWFRRIFGRERGPTV